MPAATRRPMRRAKIPQSRGATTSDRRGTTASNQAVEYLPAARPSLQARRAVFLGLQLLGQLPDDLEKVSDQPHVRDLEDPRFLVPVDGDNRLRILHSRQVLARA